MYMAFFPLATFYFSFYVLFKKNVDMLAWSGVLAIIATNIVIAAYVVMAWKEDQEDQAEMKKIQQDQATPEQHLPVVKKEL